MITGFYLAVALATPLPQVWTVDDDGPADFSSIAKAVLSVSEGDVLLVQPGSYGAFTLDKSLAILAPAGATRPAVKGISTVDGASQCTLVGLSFEVLRLESVPGRVVIDDCKIAPASASWFSTYPVALSADHCGSVLVTRTTVNGPHAFGGDDVGSYYCAVTLVDSEAAFA
jgi:hypothetical protein